MVNPASSGTSQRYVPWDMSRAIPPNTGATQTQVRAPRCCLSLTRHCRLGCAATAMQLRRLASAARHPNVMSMVGQPFTMGLHRCVTTECYDRDIGGAVRSLPPGVVSHARGVRYLSSLFAQAAAGLRHCHAAGVFHLDVKPDNVVLVADHAKLTNFAFASVSKAPARGGGGSSTHPPVRASSARHHAAGGRFGTREFAAPELVACTTASTRSPGEATVLASPPAARGSASLRRSPDTECRGTAPPPPAAVASSPGSPPRHRELLDPRGSSKTALGPRSSRHDLPSGQAVQPGTAGRQSAAASSERGARPGRHDDRPAPARPGVGGDPDALSTVGSGIEHESTDDVASTQADDHDGMDDSAGKQRGAPAGPFILVILHFLTVQWCACAAPLPPTWQDQT